MTGKPKAKATKRGHTGSSGRSGALKSRTDRAASSSRKATSKRAPASAKAKAPKPGPRPKDAAKRMESNAARKSNPPANAKTTSRATQVRSSTRSMHGAPSGGRNGPRGENVRTPAPPPWEADIFPRARRDIKPTPLTKSDVRFLRDRLLADRARLVLDLGKLESAVLKRSQRDAAGDLSAYSTHMADLGTDAMEREKDFQLASAEGRMVAFIDDALRKIGEGNYGECESCAGPIGRPRLEVVPHAAFCIQCQEKIERTSS